MDQYFSKAPNQLPDLSVLLDDIPGGQNTQLIAKHLGVDASQLTRWKISGAAPRSVQLALFWESKYGLSALDSNAHNEVMVWRVLAQSREREAASLRARITRLENLNAHGAANSPSWDSRESSLEISQVHIT